MGAKGTFFAKVDNGQKQHLSLLKYSVADIFVTVERARAQTHC